jgi:hypothetical protein
MNSRTLDCSHFERCKWEKKYRQKDEELKKTKEQLKECERIYFEEHANYYKKFQSHDNIVKQLENAKNKRKTKIALLKEIIIKKNDEIRELNDQIEFNKRKINRLVNFRHQSIDQINRLEDENEKTRKLLLTPVTTRIKKERKSMQSVRELSIKIIPFGIAETPESKNTEQEDLIKSQSLIIQKELTRNKDLQNRLEILQKEHQSLQKICEHNENTNAKAKLRLEAEKDFQIKELISKLEQIRNENLELKSKIKELVLDQSSQNTSEIFIENLKDEMLKADTSHLSFENCRTHLPTSFEQEEKQKLITMLEINMNSVRAENEKLKEKLRIKEKHSKELNKILRDNHEAFERFREQYSTEDALRRVKALNEEKMRIVREIEIKRIELNELHKKNIEKRVELERISELSLEESIRNSMANLISRQRIFPEDYKRRRNIGSWGYGLLNSL